MPRRSASLGAHHDQRARAVADLDRVAGGDEAVLAERGAQLRERLATVVRRACPRRATTERRCRVRRSVRPRPATISSAKRPTSSRGCAALRCALQRERVRRPRARHCEALGDDLAGLAHVEVVVGVPAGRRAPASRRLARGRGAARRARRAAGRARSTCVSCPPATMTSASPARIACAASITAFRPEPHTLLIVSAGPTSGIARRRARPAAPGSARARR